MAYEFNGTSQWMNGSISIGTTLTLACWFNADNATAFHSLLGVYSDATIGSRPYYELYASGAVAGDPVSFYAYSGGQAVAHTTTGYSANTWTHACGVQSASNNRTAYINGGSSATNTTTVNFTPNKFRIGASMNTSGGLILFADARIAECGIWNATLDAAEIASLAKGMTCDKVRPQSLVFYAPLVRDLLDQKGGLTITNNNGATVANHPRVYA
jgi:hypothetical protein